MSHHISILKHKDLLSNSKELDPQDIKLIHFKTASINLKQIEAADLVLYVDNNLNCFRLKDRGTVPGRIVNDLITCILNATPEQLETT